MKIKKNTTVNAIKKKEVEIVRKEPESHKKNTESARKEVEVIENKRESPTKSLAQ